MRSFGNLEEVKASPDDKSSIWPSVMPATMRASATVRSATTTRTVWRRRAMAWRRIRPRWCRVGPRRRVARPRRRIAPARRRVRPRRRLVRSTVARIRSRCTAIRAALRARTRPGRAVRPIHAGGLRRTAVSCSRARVSGPVRLGAKTLRRTSTVGGRALRCPGAPAIRASHGTIVRRASHRRRPALRQLVLAPARCCIACCIVGCLS